MKLNPPTGTDTPTEADHRKLKSEPWPMRDLKRFQSAHVISEGHALSWTFRCQVTVPRCRVNSSTDTAGIVNRLRGNVRSGRLLFVRTAFSPRSFRPHHDTGCRSRRDRNADMASACTTNPAQITSMRTAEVAAARRIPSGLSDVSVRGGGVRTRGSFQQCPHDRRGAALAAGLPIAASGGQPEPHRRPREAACSDHWMCAELE
jgi:hypothetical protein